VLPFSFCPSCSRRGHLRSCSHPPCPCVPCSYLGNSPKALRISNALAAFTDDFLVISERFLAAGMAHREVLKLVALRQRYVRHKMMVDIMAMFFKSPLLRAALIAPVLGLGVASGHSPSVFKSSPSSQAGGFGGLPPLPPRRTHSS
jgi:hypothetical protein